MDRSCPISRPALAHRSECSRPRRNSPCSWCSTRTHRHRTCCPSLCWYPARATYPHYHPTIRERGASDPTDCGGGPPEDRASSRERLVVPHRFGTSGAGRKFVICLPNPGLTGLLPTRSARVCRDLPRPLPGSTVIAVRFRWRRAGGACHRLISGTPSARSLCRRVGVIPIKPALGNGH